MGISPPQAPQLKLWNELLFYYYLTFLHPPLSFSWWPQITVMSLSPQKRGRNSDKWVHLPRTPWSACALRTTSSTRQTAKTKEKERMEMQVKCVSLQSNLVKMSEGRSACLVRMQSTSEEVVLPKAQVILVTDKPLFQLDRLQSPSFLQCVDLHNRTDLSFSSTTGDSPLWQSIMTWNCGEN